MAFKEKTMDQPRQPYTLGIWTVKPGSEDTFLSEWKAFAEWSSKNQPGAGSAYLLRDLDHPQMFVSYGSWIDSAAINRWRSTPEFKRFVGKVKTICDAFEPHSMELVATVSQ